MKDKMFSIRFDHQTFYSLKEIAEKNKVTRSFYIRKLLISSLKSESIKNLLNTQEIKTKKMMLSKEKKNDK